MGKTEYLLAAWIVTAWTVRSTEPWSRLGDLRIQLHIQPHHSYTR
jgi:hypothetical protein